MSRIHCPLPALVGFPPPGAARSPVYYQILPYDTPACTFKAKHIRLVTCHRGEIESCDPSRPTSNRRKNPVLVPSSGGWLFAWLFRTMVRVGGFDRNYPSGDLQPNEIKESASLCFAAVCPSVRPLAGPIRPQYRGVWFSLFDCQIHHMVAHL